MYLLRKANPDDKSLINTWNMGVAGPGVTNIDDYFILIKGTEEQPTGMLAIEWYDQIAYLHSLRLTKGLSSVELIATLFDHLITYCKKEGKVQLCLVVPSTSTWLMELGFSELNEVPAEIKDSAHYQRVASSGLLLVYPLNA
jgi:N-acetylglutamate synthase-like GNAT family acetyltransferase